MPPRPPRGSGDRRGADRRSTDRRAPVPVWRKPSAYVAYGVLAGLVLVAILLGLGQDDPPPVVAIQPPAERLDVADSTVTVQPTRDAFTVGDYERLMAEGRGAVGQVVRAELFCSPIAPISMRAVDEPTPALRVLADEQLRVAGAECRWTRTDRSAQFLLIVPPHLAERFAQMPEEEINFIRQRVVPADVEWLGRSDDLSLRIAGILRGIR